MPEKLVKCLTSTEAKTELKVQDCYLARIRNAGKLKFTKKGNVFMYPKESHQGSPESLVENKQSVTGKFLAEKLPVR